MTDRLSLDDMTSDQLDQLYDDLDRARQEAADWAAAESADAAAGSYAGRAEHVEARLGHVRRLHRPVGVVAAAEFGEAPDCAACRRAWPCQTYNAVTEEHAITQPERWLHIVFTSPDETTANTSALSLADHLRAEFPGVGMRISSNAMEAGEGCSPGTEETEPNNPAATEATDIETTARVFAALHRGAEETVTRVIDLYERWVKAGPPPLGTSTARWWDRRLVELRAAIHGPAEQPARTTVNNAPIRELERTDRLDAALREALDALLPVRSGGEIIGYEPPLPIQAAAVDRWRAVLDEERPEPGTHIYLSTGCLHGDHDYCKSMTGLNGAKRPGECKKCAAKCVCGCHTPPVPRDPCPHCEASSDRIPRDRMGQHIAEQHPEVKEQP